MDYLWTPWRYRYIADVKKDDECIFCAALAAEDDATTLIVFRGKKNFIILNLYPYTTGHVMVVPYLHVAELSAAGAPGTGGMGAGGGGCASPARRTSARR